MLKIKYMLLLTVLYTVRTDATGNWTLSSLNDAIQLKCIENSNNTKAAHQLENAFQDYTNCLTQSLRTYSSPHDSHVKTCENINKHVRECLVNFTMDVSVCLDDTEAYLPKLILDSFDVRYKHFCGGDVIEDEEEYLESVAQTSGSCVYILGYLEQGECISDLVIFKNLDKGILHLDKNDVYNDLLRLKKCVIELLQRNCNNDYSRYVDIMLRPYITEFEILLQDSSQ